MRTIKAGAWAALALCMAADRAWAVTYVVHMEGHITSGGGLDPNMAVGDLATLDATFGSDSVADIGGGAKVAGFYSSPYDYTIRIGALSWVSSDDISDGYPPVFIEDTGIELSSGDIFDHRELGGAPITFAGGHVTGVAGEFSPAASSAAPVLYLGFPQPGYRYRFNTTPDGPVTELFQAPVLGQSLVIYSGGGLYGNEYVSPGFSGAWDFDHSTVRVLGAVPEPETWIMMLASFAAVGGLLRLRQPLRRAGLSVVEVGQAGVPAGMAAHV